MTDYLGLAVNIGGEATPITLPQIVGRGPASQSAVFLQYAVANDSAGFPRC